MLVSTIMFAWTMDNATPREIQTKMTSTTLTASCLSLPVAVPYFWLLLALKSCICPPPRASFKKLELKPSPSDSFFLSFFFLFFLTLSCSIFPQPKYATKAAYIAFSLSRSSLGSWIFQLSAQKSLSSCHLVTSTSIFTTRRAPPPLLALSDPFSNPSQPALNLPSLPLSSAFSFFSSPSFRASLSCVFWSSSLTAYSYLT